MGFRLGIDWLRFLALYVCLLWGAFLTYLRAAFCERCKVFLEPHRFFSLFACEEFGVTFGRIEVVFGVYILSNLLLSLDRRDSSRSLGIV